MINTKPTASFFYDQYQNLNVKCSIKLPNSFKNYSFYVTGLLNELLNDQNNSIYSITVNAYSDSTGFVFNVPYYYNGKNNGYNVEYLQVKILKL